MMSFFKDKERKKKNLNHSPDMINTDSSNSELNLNEQHENNQNINLNLSPNKLSSSSKSSIDSSNNQQNQLQQPILPPKPKKGILKTMSKFGIGSSTSSSNSTPKLLPKLAHQIEKQQSESVKTIESSIPTYSKRNSQYFINDSTNNTTIFNIPNLKIIPSFITSLTQIKNEDTSIETNLIRMITIQAHQINRIELIQLNDQTHLTPVLIDCLESQIDSFLPGDQLLSINDEYVLEKSLNECKCILNTILNQSNSNDLIRLKVRTSLECSDFIIKNLNSSSSLSSLNSAEINSTADTQESDLDNVWLLNSNGSYSQAKIFAKVIHKNSNTSLDNLPQNLSNQTVKFKIRLDNGTLIEVNEESLEKSNPSKFNYCNDLSKLRFINETSLLHCLRQRYYSLRLTHTLIGNQNLVIMRPKLNSVNLLNDKLAHFYKNYKQISSNPPAHVYSYTQSIYKNMLSNRQDQTICLVGHSSSGKTVNTRQILNYLFKVSSVQNSNFNDASLNSIEILLNAFCSIRTDLSMYSNRFLNLYLLEFNHSGQLLSLFLQLINFDQTRLIHQAENETNFLIFYYLIFCSNQSIRTDLYLNNDVFDFKTKSSITSTGNLFFNSDKCLNDDCLFTGKLDLILDSFKQLNFNEYEIRTILSILSSIIHLGRAGACKSNTNTSRGQFENITEAQKAAQLLGISLNQLNDFIFNVVSPNQSNTTPNRNKYSHLSNNGSVRISPDTGAQSSSNPIECLQGFSLGLYQECLNLIVNCINRFFKQTSQTQATANSMLIIDPPGFQYNMTKTSSYSDLISNYLNERLQLMFFQVNFINPIEKCAQEGLDIDLVEHIPESPSSLVNWFDKPPHPNTILSRGLNSPQIGLNDIDNNSQIGLLWLLEEQINKDQLAREKNNFRQKIIDSDLKQNFMTTNESNFKIYHQFGNFPVDYDLENWLELFNKEFLTQRNALTCLQDSKKEMFQHSFGQNGFYSSNNLASSSLNSIENGASSSTLKRQASVRKMLTLSKRKTFMINFKLQIDSLFDSMRKTKCNFIFCLLPNREISEKMVDDFDMKFVRNQLKAYQILATCRIYRQGYPEYLNQEEFVRRFSLFLNNDSLSVSSNKNEMSNKELCSSLIKSFDLDDSLFKLGNTQIFFKAGVLAKLEEQRDEKVNDLVVRLQANCRQYLAKKNYERKKIQDSAIRCVQKNIRIWFALKKWKWWRLYTNLMPILNVQNHEHMLVQLRNELDDYKRKNERLQNEKNELKILNNQLENKFMNLQTEYVEEHAANAGTIDLLEVETSERIRLEKELNELRPLYNETIKKLEIIETEMLELRLYNTKKSIEQELVGEKDDIDGLSVSNNSSSSPPIHHNQTNNKQQNQIEFLKRENEMLKRQLKQENESLQLLNMNERHFFETKLKEKENELIEMEKQNAFHKRKYQKLCEEMQDMERLCDENKVRNRELERIQAKFDAEMQTLRHKYETEKELREKCERERDAAKYEIFSLKSDLDTQKLETNYHLEKCERLEKDLKDYESNFSSNNTNLNLNGSSDQYLKLKSQLRDLEAKFRDQEEELDEQTGSIQQLLQTKLKLEMQLEKEKQKWTREIAEKESEMDDLRFNTQKKIKAIEMQLEEESEIASNLQREKRELERKIRELTSGSNGKKSLSLNNEFISNESLNEYVNKLKRQMLKYKTIAIDAQTQLEKLRENIPKQSILKALKSQLEDSEFTKANALKTKQLLQVEIENLQQQLDDAISHKQNLEEQNMHLNRELNNLKSELEEQERDADEILKKYQLHIQNYTLDSHRFLDLSNQIDILTIENRILKEKIREMEDKVSNYETCWVDRTLLNKLENKTRELESKLEFETTHKTKVQNQLERVKQQYENSLNEIEIILSREKKCDDMLRRTQRHNKEILEDFGDLKKKLIDLEETRKRLEQQNEILERELESSRSELKINQKRLETFQNALNSMNNETDNEIDGEDEEDDEENESVYEDVSTHDEILSIRNGNADYKYLNSSSSKISNKSDL